MHYWIMVLFIGWTGHGSATSVGPFKTEASCVYQVQQAQQRAYAIDAFCVPVDGAPPK